jgi:hypothetical protein
MLRNAKTLRNFSLRARDGLIGETKDLYFDNREWTVRYFVVDTGTWLKSRKVLISPEAINRPQWDEDAASAVLPVNLTRDQVRHSPDIDTEKPVSRQREDELRRYYSWSAYGGGVFLGGGIPATDVPMIPTRDIPPPSGYESGSRAQESAEGDIAIHEHEGDPHLHSCSAVTGYHIGATDGEIGHVEDFLVDDRTWEIRYLVVDTRNWWPGKKVIVAPAWIREINWSESKVSVDLDRATIQRSPEYDPARPVTADYAGRLHDYYGRGRYTNW